METNRKNRFERQRLLAGQGGWTLIELLVTMTMMLAVVFAALPIVEGATNTEGRIQTSATSIGEARTFSDQVLQDLRPASQVKFDSGSREIFTTWVRHNTCGDPNPIPASAAPIQCDVTYNCLGTAPNVSCSRQEEGGPVVTEISGLGDPNIFSSRTPGDQPVFIRLKIEIPNPQDSAQNEITLRDGTALRNVQ
jgi:type II secretory pathway pseudopilin PulG